MGNNRHIVGMRSVRGAHRAFGRAIVRTVAGALSVLLVGSAMALGAGVAPVRAMEGATLQLVKKVDGQKERLDLSPGDTVEYRIDFSVEDEDADSPVTIVDRLPAEFAGWRISNLTATVGGSTTGVTLELPGVVDPGPASPSPAEGTLGADAGDLTITVGVALPVQAGEGNASGLGMSTGKQGVLRYRLTVPEGISPLDPALDRPLVNTATFSAKSGAQDLSTEDTATISIEVPIEADVEPRKTWAPAGQDFQPGRSSQLVIGAVQASNVDASRLSLQDPADPALAPDGATALHADNPFNYVDFAGFASPSDPTTNLPAGATAAAVQVYRLADGAWNWADWDAAIPNDRIAGVRTSYTGAIPPGTEASQGFAVEQRATHRSTGESLSAGYEIENDVRATVEVADHPAVSKETEAPFAVGAERIEVDAQKRFYALPDGDETANLTGITAGDSVGVVLRAINREAPRSTVLDRLIVKEPGAGSDARFFGADLVFDGFGDDTSAIWPTGATQAEVTWEHPGGPTTVAVPEGDPLPAAPAGATGFEIAFTGAIEPGAYSEIRYELRSNPAETFVPAGGTAGPFVNAIDVVGERAGLDPDDAGASATVSYVAPRIDVEIDKRVGPGTVLPGQTVIVQLDTEVSTAGGRTKPTRIVVEDVMPEAPAGAGTFWDAFDAKQILPPISRPTNGGEQATLTIERRGASGAWHVLATDPDENAAIDVPTGTTGLRFVYENTAGLSQATYVKPNISFTARTHTRTAGEPTSGTFDSPVRYENTATATGTGELDSRVVTGSDEDRIDVGIRGTEGGTGPGPGGVWAAKQWAHDYLTSQSGATSSTVQSWAVARDGYRTVELQDPASPSATGAGTVFEAFDLTHIRPIGYEAPAGSGTIDPLLRWDTVAAVELWDGTSWNPVSPPAGGWMGANGFVGHELTASQRASALGVRLVVEENTAARQAAHDPQDPDLTAPEPGSGVTASADTRSFRLDWQLRDTARTADGSLKWVKETGTAFNCGAAADGCVDNTFGVVAHPETGEPVRAGGNDTIQLVDGTTNVGLGKLVRPLPTSGSTPSADSIGLVAPNPGELEQADYPRARYTLTARNSSTQPQGSRGAMKLGKIRVTDTSTACGATCPLPASTLDFASSPFAGRDFANEVASIDGNHFDEFDLTGVGFGTLPGYIDAAESTVELWLYDGTPSGTTRVFTLQQAISEAEAFVDALPNAIGIAVTYSGTDPGLNGNRILVGDDLVMHLDVRLRATERLSGRPVQGGESGSAVNVPNTALARGWDAVVDPSTQPTDTDGANIELTQARVRVGLEKSISVDHGDSSDRTILETDPQAPVNVRLTADPDGSTAPLDTLRIEDRTASFWDRFAFVSFGTPTHPTDADSARLEVIVDGDWEVFADYTGDLDEIRGVRATFSRTTGNGLFPQGATSWNASWGTATLPFTVVLRDDAAVDWSDDQEENLATAFAENEEYGEAEAEDDDRVVFSPGTNAIEVIKRAPNDTGDHRIDPLVSLPWRLVFTNTGTGYLPVTKVTDALPAALDWDGEQPTVNVTPGDSGSGLGEDPSIELSADGRNLVFAWPAGQRMHPGERVEVELGLILQPVGAGQRATNGLIVETGVPLDTCTQPRTHGQDPQAPTAENLCTNNNFVEPEAGTVIGARKTVNGEPAETLGEHLVSGALDVRTDEECAAGNFLPIGSDYTRNPCASYTAVGATDTWKLENMNVGTNALSRMTIVDMLPNPGDKMLAGGAARTSTFRPVLVDPSAIRLTGLPDGAVYTVEVTTNPAACVGAGSGSLWLADPECSDTTANPANIWTLLDDYTGEIRDIVGLRFKVDMTANALPPAGSVVVEFETVNRVIDQSDAGLQPTLEQFAERQFAWNQNGLIAWDTAGNRVNLPKAPQRAGVTVKTGSLVVTKQVQGEGADNAPDEFPVELVCTVPSGAADPARVPLDMGEHATLSVPKNGSVTVDGIPVGADCTARETGEVGAHGEVGRSIETAPGVAPATDGLSADIRIRVLPGDAATELKLSNTYTLGELVIEKSLASGDEHELDPELAKKSFEFELVCPVAGTGEDVRRVFSLRAGERHGEAGLPVGAVCTLTETGTGGAAETTITVGGDETDGTSRDDISIAESGGHVLVTNLFPGVLSENEEDHDDSGIDSDDLERTGAQDGLLLAATGLALLALGTIAVGAALSRRSRATGTSGS